MGEANFLKERAALFLTQLFLVLLFGLLLVFPIFSYAADDSLCAEVKIEIKQELTLERQAFDAHMRIRNGLSHITLENIDVDVLFTDEEGNSVLASSDPDNQDALFFIRLDSMENIDDVNGAGTIAPLTSSDIHWLIIPAPGASNGLEQGTLYYVGATLVYTIGGEEHVTEVTPDYIFVKPMPELVLDYFLPEDVYGDDAFTPEIESPVPFSLGVRVKNNGFGVAIGLKIDSAQPKIVENEQGLLIGFVIEGSEVNGQPATESLLVDFGDIEPNISGVARWIMICTLSGQFVEFEAEYSHSDELGGELTSLLQAVNTHTLIQDVLVDVPGRDAIRDFFAKDGDVYRVYESDSTDTEVLNQSASSSLNGSGENYTLETPVTAGFMYVRLPDPHGGQKEIKDVVRSDGKRIKPGNVWLSKTREGSQPWEYFFNLFDANTTNSYTVNFEDPAAMPHAPVLTFVSDKTALEGQQVSFVVEATDPDGTIPTLTASSLPALASFTDQGDGSGVFDWTPAVGQAGHYEITFRASDGVLEDSQRVALTIYSIDDTDGDGMSDAWEMEHFGTLDRDGTGDFDGDGVSDLDEFLNGTDPTDGNNGPSLPGIHAPEKGAEITNLQPQLVIQNSTDQDGDTLTYVFELYANEEMNTLVADASGVAEGTGTTSWNVPAELSDNTWYFWRARATDGILFSQWAYGSFFVNTENDSPGEFSFSSPWDNSEVDTPTPVLQVTNSVDIDEDGITYTFWVYSDSSMNTLVASASDIPEGAEGGTSWVVDASLNDNIWYYWKAVATDEHGATAESPLTAFLVNTVNTAPKTPVILSPGVGSEVVLQELNLAVINATDPDGDALSYVFQLDKVNIFDSEAGQTSGEVSEGEGTTPWHVAGLEDNSRYYWRVKASDGSAESTWAVGSFFVNAANDMPSIPTLRNPGQGSWVDTPTPMLQLNPSGDSDNDSLSYRFEVYADDSLTNLLVQGESDTTRWPVSSALTDRTWNYWRVQAVDEHGLASAWTAAAAFFVMDNGVDDPPEITILEPAAHLLTNQDTVLIRWEDNDPDSNATISLYYDTDDSGEDGTLIVAALEEDPEEAADTYMWDISGLEGTYYIYASITDGNFSITSYGQAAITIDRTPPTGEAAPPGGTYSIAQTVSLSADEAAEIYYTNDGTAPTNESFLYKDPIEITETTTLKLMAVDGAGNQSETITEVYTIVEEPVNLAVTVVTDKGRELSGVKVYAFTESGSYTGKNSTTDESGTAFFALEDFEDGNYKFRVDYLGSQFWSQMVTMPGTAAIEVMIEEETVAVAVTTGSGPAEGVRVYLFSESGSYLGIYEVTDTAGMVYFDLPVGRGFKFRADILGGQYWSDIATVSGGGMNSASVEAGGGLFQVTVEKTPGSPMEGIKVYLFSQSGSYLGRYAVTNASGVVEFSVPERTYKVRADYLGYRFWSAETQIIGDTGMALTITHQQVDVTVQGVFQDVPEPIEGIKVYLFSSAGSYLGQYQRTDSSGKVTFNLPEKAYRVRADYLGQQFWFDEFTWENVTIEVLMADAEITVTGAGFPKEGVKIYVFSSSVSYLGLFDTTDNDGKVTFRIPEGTYRFRADYQGSQFWSPDSLLAKDQVNYINISTGGGAFTVTVLKGASEPLLGVNCYVLNEEGSYLGMFGATNSDGQATFDLSDGAYKFRVDYLGYHFWSDVVTIPNISSVEVLIDQEEVEVAVAMGSGPAEGVKVYLFSETDTYLGIYDITDLDGRVIFALPVGKAFKFRADILNNQYWSDVHTVIAGGANHVSINAGGGLFQVTLEKGSGIPMEGIRVYLFSQTGSYLGLYEVTDASGVVGFDVPEGTYKVRVDYLGYKFWRTETQVTGDTNIVLTIPHQPVEVTVQGVFQNVLEPIEGIKVYLFSSTGSYLGQYQQTNSSGKITFDMPEKAYKVRADYLGQQFWSEEFTWQNVTVEVPMANAEITVTGAGLPQQGVNVYVFSAAGSYLGINSITDLEGKVTVMSSLIWRTAPTNSGWITWAISSGAMVLGCLQPSQRP
jgi:hypothetical protein